jgi:hypothetical protein
MMCFSGILGVLMMCGSPAFVPVDASAPDTIPSVSRDTLTERELESIIELELERRDLSITDAAEAELTSALQTVQSLPETTERVRTEAALFKNIDFVADRRGASVVNSTLLQQAIVLTCRPPRVWPQCQG